MGLLKYCKNIFIKRRKKLGVALGGGGAKGMALLGALRAFEENGISFDMVAGTSIGAIIGGLYASGNSTSEIFGFLQEFDVTKPKTLVALKLKGHTLQSVLDQMTGGKEIQELQKPFFAVCCDLYSGEQVVVSRGNLARAMACSSAVPPFFAPVVFGNNRLIDGVLVNSVPADVLKNNGADVVIAVCLTSPTDNMNTKNKMLIDRLYPKHGVKVTDRLSGLKSADFVITPNLNAYSGVSIFSLSKIYELGYEQATKQMPQILQMLKDKRIIKR